MTQSYRQRFLTKQLIDWQLRDWNEEFQSKVEFRFNIYSRPTIGKMFSLLKSITLFSSLAFSATKHRK